MRSYCCWPGMNDSIEKFIGSCEICQETQNFSNNSVLLSWPTALNSFYRVNIDFFHKYNYSFLILVDNKSKWIDVKLMDEGTNAKETILKLKQVFSIFGLPVEIVSDNGPPFNSVEFITFCQVNGIKPVKTPPYHPQSNGIAEKAVQTVKKGLQKSLFLDKNTEINKKTILNRLENFLFVYRNTPCTSTGVSPSENIFKVRPRTRYDLLKPSFNEKLKLKSDITRNAKIYSLNELVYVKNKQTKLWQKGKIVKVISYSTYLVQIDTNIKFVHANDIRSNPYNQVSTTVCTCNNNHELQFKDLNRANFRMPVPSSSNVSNNTEYQTPIVSPKVSKEVVEAPSQISQKFDRKIDLPTRESSLPNIDTGTPKTSRISRSGRVIKPPSKLNL